MYRYMYMYIYVCMYIHVHVYNYVVALLGYCSMQDKSIPLSLSPTTNGEKGETMNQTKKKQAPTDSIAVRVSSCLGGMAASLQEACSPGLSAVFSLSGPSRPIFPAAYTSFLSQVSELETNISSYLTVC